MQATLPRTTAAAVVLAALIPPRSRCSSGPATADARTAAAAVVLAALISPRSPCSSRPAPADARTASAVVVLVALIPPRAAATAVRLSRTAAAAAHRPLLATAPPLPQLGCQRWPLHDRHCPRHS